jgi:hypothetical protein
MVVPAHGLARWVHAKLEIVDGVLRWGTPVTLLGIVPLGRRHIEVPAAEVSDIRVRRTVRPVTSLIGLTTMVLPLLVGWAWWVLLITVPLGLWIVLVSLGPRMEAVTVTGEVHHVSVCFAHQIDADLYMAAVEDIAAETGSSHFEGSAS